MDAHALLTSQGWRGSGHTLHAHSDDTGLSRPILVSKKQNNLGVGKKQHRTSDMWWMNAFDKSLKGLDTSEDGKVVQTVTNGGLDMVAKGGARFVGSTGLYASFVRGESLSGTLTPEKTVETEVENETETERLAIKMARRAAETEIENETETERLAKKVARHAAKALSVADATTATHRQSTKSSANDTNMSTDDRRARKEARRAGKLDKRKKHMIAATVAVLCILDEEKKKKKRRRDG